ncbi:MAG TPA: hypothetical protein VKP65_21170 [Rhodothermales bacterium]|nr:hypothetical protein [Rhodothermales bacterium]
MKHVLLIVSLLFFAACADTDTDAPASLDGEAIEAAQASSAPDTAAAAESDDLTGTWELVEQRGYGPDHPDDVEQSLTFTDDGRMINEQSTGGQSTTMVLTYHVEGDQIVATVESVEINGEALDMDGEALDMDGDMPGQTFQWQIENGQLIITDGETQDIYRRAG